MFPDSDLPCTDTLCGNELLPSSPCARHQHPELPVGCWVLLIPLSVCTARLTPAVPYVCLSFLHLFVIPVVFLGPSGVGQGTCHLQTVSWEAREEVRVSICGLGTITVSSGGAVPTFNYGASSSAPPEASVHQEA